MSNGLKIVDCGLSIANNAVSIYERATNHFDAAVERKASNKVAYAYKTIANARHFMDNNDLSNRDVNRCEALLDEFVSVTREDIRSTLKRW